MARIMPFAIFAKKMDMRRMALLSIIAFMLTLVLSGQEKKVFDH